MKYLLTLFVVAALISCSPKNPSDPKFVVAKVDGDPIYREELNQSLDMFLQSQGGTRENLPEALIGQVERQILNQIVDGRLVVAKASEQFPDKLNEETEKEFETFVSRIGDEEKYREMLEKLGTTEEVLKEQIKQSVALNILMENAESGQNEVSDEAAKKFYDENPQYWEQPEMIQARHVLVKVDPDASDADKKAGKDKIDEARKRIVGGEAFGDVAREVSDDTGSGNQGGMLPPFSKGRMVPEFEKMAFSSEKGKVSPVFSTQFGYHFLEVMQKKDAQTLEYDEVADRIKSNLKSSGNQLRMQKQLEDLRDNAEIEILLPEPEEMEMPAQVMPPMPQ